MVYLGFLYLFIIKATFAHVPASWGEYLHVELLRHDLVLAPLLKVRKSVMAPKQKFISCSHNSSEQGLILMGTCPQ